MRVNRVESHPFPRLQYSDGIFSQNFFREELFENFTKLKNINTLRINAEFLWNCFREPWQARLHKMQRKLSTLERRPFSEISNVDKKFIRMFHSTILTKILSTCTKTRFKWNQKITNLFLGHVQSNFCKMISHYKIQMIYILEIPMFYTVTLF